MRYIIVDLEAACRESGMPRTEMEIIEIGAVELLAPTAEPTRAFARFVRPVLHPDLSEFCSNLTTIVQHDVDTAESFPAVFAAFLEWIGPEPYQLCSWGAYDLGQFLQDCTRHGITPPETFTPERHLNLKKRFSEKYAVKPMGMAGALRLLGLPLVGQHHRGIDDAYNIAAIARQLLG